MRRVYLFLKALHGYLPNDPAIPLIGIYPRQMKTISAHIYTGMFIASFFIKAKKWKQLNVHQRINRFKNLSCIPTWNVIWPWKGTKHWHVLHTTRIMTWMNLENMMWKKPDTREHKWFHQYDTFIKGNLDRENRLVIGRAWEWEQGLIPKEFEGVLLSDKNVVKLDDDSVPWKVC